jgi:hypothetical protein
MIDDKTFNTVAQLGHFAGGAAIVLAFTVIAWNRQASIYGLLTVAALAAIKEFWYDQRYETPEVRGSSLEDFSFYLVGATIATAVSLWL